MSQSSDPFAMFKVQAHVCDLFHITVLEGRNITKGYIGDMMDTPDPYVRVNIYEAPDSIKKTKCVSNDTCPKWFETLPYYLPTNPQEPTIAKISLLDSNYTIDESLGTIEFDCNQIKVGDEKTHTFKFYENSEIDICFKREINKDYNLRYSLALSKEEKNFRMARKEKAQARMCELLGEERAPRSVSETPCIAMMGSGGGYRALVGFTGAIAALHELGVFDCVTYTVGLSGSTWCMSSLYTHPSFPEHGVKHAFVDLRKNMDKSFINLLRPSSIMRYLARIGEKRNSGQPVTITDLFGLIVGEHLLGSDRVEDARLSDFAAKIEGGAAPLPLMTSLHVRPDLSAQVYHEWIEFSPYEIGMAKYGTFVKTSEFNNKFFMGVVSKIYKEAPLHFLMGVWGSAFSILFDRLVSTADKTQKHQHSKQKMESHFDELRHENYKIAENAGDVRDEESDDENEDLTLIEDAHRDEEMEEAPSGNTSTADAAESRPKKEGFFSRMMSMVKSEKPPQAEESSSSEKSPPEGAASGKEGHVHEEQPSVTESDSGVNTIKNTILHALMRTKFFGSREYRAGKILNFMRGLEVSCTYPLSPFTGNEKNTSCCTTFSRLDETISGKKKRVFVVDAGLAYNSPYPAVLRPQRFVDLIFSFDFSARKQDDMDPFSELRLAERWAGIHNIPFPKIDYDVYKREGLKELYIFKDPENEKAPVILHFCLCNVSFRKFSAPGVAREEGDTRGDFDLFVDQSPYSTFDFHYSHDEFDKLHELVKFNTLLNKDKILEAIGECTEMRRRSRTRFTISKRDIENARTAAEERKRMFTEKFGHEFANFADGNLDDKE